MHKWSFPCIMNQIKISFEIIAVFFFKHVIHLYEFMSLF